MPESAEPDALEASSAASFFLQRAQQAAAMCWRPREREAVWQICRLVAGLPLGIELAAAWVANLVVPGDRAGEFSARWMFLAATARDVPERHRSIRAAFEHSWALLSAPEEQRVLRHVAVFRGGFGREAAPQVLSSKFKVQSSKSTSRNSKRSRCYSGHWSPSRCCAAPRPAAMICITWCASMRLISCIRTSRKRAEIRPRHGQYYAALLERRGAAFKGPEQPAVVAELMAELANMRLAWEWAATHRRAADG